MNEDHLISTAKTLNIGVTQVAATAKLLGEGATIPFIARYRKEATGTLDEVQIAKIRDELERLKAMDDRRAAIKKSLEERKLDTPELLASLDAADSIARLEDIYQPFKPKRRTRATIAKEKGLEPLANFIFENQNADFAEEAAKYVDAEKEVADVEAALAGARDIIAEAVNDDAGARGAMREYFENNSVMSSKLITGKEAEAAKYRDYFEWSEPAKTAPSHRILAVRRGESEGFLIMRVVPEEEGAIAILKKMFVRGDSPCAKQVALAVEDCYRRLLASSSETHMRLEIKKRADEEAVKIFASNLRELLMASPLGNRNVLAIDPGFRTGCKVVCLNRQGDLLHNDVVYPEQGSFKEREAAEKILKFCKQFEIEAIAIGNGTAGRETEAFVRKLGLPASLPVIMVNESGASIYSASEVAREEFPDQDITVRGAVSIGRRLMDPLAELVKIDPQSIGVGQYQHDVNQTMLKRSLDDVVMSCVNSVGVEVNTASKQLLSYVSGLNATTAANIVAHRNENGPFKSRKELLKVKGLGAKGFEQAAGFLRIRDGKNPLDASAVHPERYETVERMAADLGADGNAIGGLAVGEPTEKMYEMIEVVNEILPADKPRYLMGVGTPANILEGIDRGVDMFDCVMPTRNGRNGMVFTSRGIMNMRNRKWADDFSPLDEEGTSFVDTAYSKAYLRHLFVADEILAMQIASIHNLAFYVWLSQEARRHILDDTFTSWKREMMERVTTRL